MPSSGNRLQKTTRGHGSFCSCHSMSFTLRHGNSNCHKDRRLPEVCLEPSYCREADGLFRMLLFTLRVGLVAHSLQSLIALPLQGPAACGRNCAAVEETIQKWPLRDRPAGRLTWSNEKMWISMCVLQNVWKPQLPSVDGMSESATCRPGTCTRMIGANHLVAVGRAVAGIFVDPCQNCENIRGLSSGHDSSA